MTVSPVPMAAMDVRGQMLQVLQRTRSVWQLDSPAAQGVGQALPPSIGAPGSRLGASPSLSQAGIDMR